MALFLAVAGCTGQATEPMDDLAGVDVALDCPNDLPACPAPPPSWSGAVSGIVGARCATCHAPGGLAAEKPLTSYTEVFPRRSAVLNQVYACLMPMTPDPPLSTDERQALLGWLVCGAPDN